MLGILGLLTGWLLLIPAFVLIYLQFGGPPLRFLWPVMSFASSVPMLGFSTIAGLALIFFSIRSLTRRPEPLMPH
jgi:hypothetical protein